MTLSKSPNLFNPAFLFASEKKKDFILQFCVNTMSALDLQMLYYFSHTRILLSLFSCPLVLWGKYMFLSKKWVNCVITSHLLVLSLESLPELSGDRNYVLFLFFFFFLRILCTLWILSISCLMMIDKNRFNCSASPLWKMLASTRILHPLTVPSRLWAVLKLKSK